MVTIVDSCLYVFFGFIFNSAGFCMLYVIRKCRTINCWPTQASCIAEVKNHIDAQMTFLFLGTVIDYHLTLGLFYSTKLSVIKTQFIFPKIFLCKWFKSLMATGDIRNELYSVDSSFSFLTASFADDVGDETCQNLHQTRHRNIKHEGNNRS